MFFIMKSHNSSSVTDSGESNRSVKISKVNRCKCVHLLSTIRRPSFTEGQVKHRRWISFKFLYCSNSGKSRRVKEASTRSTSSCRQFLIIYEAVRNVFLFRIATDVTSFGSIPLLLTMSRTFNFLRRIMSLCKSFGWSIKRSFSVCIFGQKGRIHLTNSVKYKWRSIFGLRIEHFNDFSYQQEIYTNLKIANSEQNPGSVSKTINSFKIQE
jgi:hypothetical protein